MRRTEPFRLAWKNALKETVWLLTRFRPGPQRPVCLFSSRRAGSTWLMEVIAANRGVRYLDQPLSLYRFAPAHAGRLPVLGRSQFIALDPDEEAQLRSFVQDLLEGTTQVNAPWEVWRPTFHWTSRRVVLKILAAKPIIDWFDRSFDVHVVYSTRHPIPTALSIIRNGWALTAPAYLRSARFTEAHLDETQVAYAWDLLRDGTPLEQHVLNWVLENLVPLRLLPERPHWLFVPYEAATLDPTGTVDLFADRLGLPDRERMLKQARVASRSTRRVASTFDPAQAARERLRSWRRHVAEAEEEDAFRVLDRFGVGLYRRGEDLPVWERGDASEVRPPQLRPVEPNPPAPRAVAPSASTGSNRTGT